MLLKKYNNEVLFVDDTIISLSTQDIRSLELEAEKNPRKRIRVCVHPNTDDLLHEMFIVHTKDTYVRPHKHLGKSESIHVIEGLVDVVLFDDLGNLTEVLDLGDYASGSRFYYRSSDPIFHTLLIKSETIIFHETTNGPFDPADTVWAPWAPEYGDVKGEQLFMEQLRENVLSIRAL